MIRFHYNIHLQEALGFSPFELIYGRKPNTPLMENKSEDTEKTNERIQRINERQMEVMKKRREMQKKKQRILKEHVKTGDLVL